METVILTAIALLAVYTVLSLNNYKKENKSNLDFEEQTSDLFAKDKEYDLSTPLIEKLEHSLITEDKEHDLTRGFDYEEEVRHLDLFELDKGDDVSRPYA